MSWKINILLIGVFLLLFQGCGQKEKQAEQEQYFSTKHLIETHELADWMAKGQSFTLIDFRKEAQYLQAHIPGAVQVWRPALEDSSFVYGGMMASRKQLEETLCSLGARNDVPIIIYDDNGACEAARLWWVLLVNGESNTKILNGGLTAWKADGHATENGHKEVAFSNYRLPETGNKPLYIAKDEVKEALNRNVVLLDVRSEDEYTGIIQRKSSSRPGRIPGAVLLDWAHAIDYHGTKRFWDINTLRQKYEGIGITPDLDVIVYCQSGVRSSHTTFVLTQLLGYTKVRNYDGSWREWSFHTELPIETGQLTKVVNKNYK
ncbi:MAG TPA: sulfurtransferase [Cytophagales bacterium]|mgnify:CR=1 FL=1|jgi:thiosulfate/3-mercaptopyruvate sulfurtransferase|nr:sulfurtransferase [Cytophagales bacterium]